jgi:DNA-binding transcriptional LysR family regulator
VEADMLNLEYLEHFLLTTKYMSITEASEKLFMTQSTLSRQISALEDECRAALFDRSGRKLRLTEAGRRLQERAVSLLDLESQIVSNVRASENRTSSKIVVHTLPGVFKSMEWVYRRMFTKHPEIEISFHRLQMEELTSELAQNVSDFGITYTYYFPDDLRFLSLPLETEPFVVVCSPEHHFADLESVTLEDCLRETVLFGADFPLMLKNMAPLETYRPFRPHGNMDTLQYRVLANAGVIILPRSTASTFPFGLRRIPISDEDISLRIVLIYKKGKQGNKACRYFIKEAEMYAKMQQKE